MVVYSYKVWATYQSTISCYTAPKSGGGSRHPERKTFDDHICVERFKNISRNQRIVDPRILVSL